MFSKVMGSVRLAQEDPQSPTVGHLPSSSALHDEQTSSFPVHCDDAARSDLMVDDMNDSPSQSTHASNSLPPVPGSNNNNNGSWPRPISLANFSPGLPFRLPSYTNPSRAFPSWMLAQPSSITISSTPATTNVNARPRRKHARKNSWYTVRHHHHHRRQSSTGGSLHIPPSSSTTTSSNKKQAPLLAADFLNDMPSSSSSSSKKSSNKLLCLWPLPVVTRWMIALSLIISAMNFGGLVHLSCSSPSLVIHRLEVGNLFLSPFFITSSLHTFFLFGWNILILGLFEESLAHMLGGTQRFVGTLLSIVLAVCTVRQAIGYLFSKSTGFAVPRLFFSDSLHECSQGLAPFLFALLVIQSLSIDDKYILIIGNNLKITVRKFVLQLVMLLVNYTVKNILWWSLTGLLIGYLATIAIQACLAWHHPMMDEDDETEEDVQTSVAVDEKEEFGYNTETPFVRRYRRTPLWRLLWSGIKNGAMVVMITLPLLLLFNAYYTRETYVDPATLNSVTHDRYMFTFVVMTAPRRGSPAYLSRTLDSYLTNWPVDPEPGSLYDRTQAIVYTHFTNHTEFDLAKARFSNDLRGQRYLKWVREDGNVFDQRLHVSKALSLAADNFQSTYVALVEDDFPMCGENEWRQTQNVVYAANQRVPGHCGVFVGTGGSGLFIKPKIARLASRLLLKYDDMPPDIVLQNCVAGLLPECSECSQTLVTSKTLLMYHIGFNTSTSEDRAYKKHDFQCGWRHPFNGDPNVITL